MAGVWIVNPFDPLPGDPEQPGRYASLGRMLVAAGHRVIWWTSDFSHRFKRPVDQAALTAACRADGIEPVFVASPPYRRNVSLRRLASHRTFAARLERTALQRLTDPSERPDVIIASNPPPDGAAAAARIAQGCGARLIVDVQDIWVENFRRLMPAAMRPASRLLLSPWIAANRRAYAAADAVVGVAGPYADEARRYGRHSYRREVIPLGIDLKCFDAAVRAGRSLLPPKEAGEVRAIYSGSLSISYDVGTVARVAAAATRRRPELRVLISGRGDLESEVRSIIADCARVTFLGFAPFEDWAATLATCDVGWNAIRPENLIYFPNKIFYYWAAGLAVVNSLPGECGEWVERTASGVNYRCGDIPDAGHRLDDLLADPGRLADMKRNARESAERRWDRQRLYVPYLDLITELATRNTT